MPGRGCPQRVRDVAGLPALALPVAQYPEVVPPRQVTTTYPGALGGNSRTYGRDTVEQEINGVENMLYMSSQSTGDGTITVTHRTDSPDNASRPGRPAATPVDVQTRRPSAEGDA